MKMDKEEVDKLIAESLDEEDARFYSNLEEEGVLKSWGRIYTGKMAWLAVVMTIMHIIVAFIAFYCAYKLFTVTEMIDILRYGTVLFIALIFASVIKLLHWMQIHKNTMVREMKRMEFQIAILMEKITEK